MDGIFLDTETLGLSPLKHAIVEISFKILDLSTQECKAVYSSVVKQPREAWEQKDPGSLMINGFTWEEIEQGEPIPVVAREVIDIFSQANIQRGSSVFICQNPSFDRAFFSQLIDTYTQEKLNWPYHWLDLASMFWAMQVRNAQEQQRPIPHIPSFSKDSIAKVYNLPPEQTPHRSLNGVDHLIACYKAVLNI